MSCIKKDQIWQSLIGEPHEFIVDQISEDGWVNGRQVNTDPKGKKKPVERTNMAIHHDTMKLTMKKVG